MSSSHRDRELYMVLCRVDPPPVSPTPADRRRWITVARSPEEAARRFANLCDHEETELLEDPIAVPYQEGPSYGVAYDDERHPGTRVEVSPSESRDDQMEGSR